MSWRKIAALPVLLCMAVPARALTIEDALAEAARTNPEIQAARDASRSVQERVPLALALRIPSVRLGTEAGLQRTDYSAGTIDREHQSIGLVVEQNLFSSGRTSALLRKADVEVQQSHAVVADVEQMVLLRVATAYLNVLRAKGTVQLREAALEVFEAVQRETQAQFRVGDRTQADLAQSNSEWTLAVADLASAKADLETQRALFEALVGLPPDNLVSPAEATNLPETLRAARDTALENHPGVRVAEKALRAADQASRVAVGEAGARLDLEGRIARTVGDAPPNTETSIVVRLAIPLYEGGAGGARIRQARRTRSQRRGELMVAKRSATERVTGAWNGLLAARHRHEALTSAVEASHIALAAIRREAEVGERTTREILDAERSLVSQQVSKLETMRDIVVGSYRLLAAIGALDSASLRIVGVPSLEREAQDARRNLWPGILSIIRN